MCLIISIESEHQVREQLTAAAALASTHGVRVEMRPESWWPWRRRAVATLTEEGGCSCSLLADEADWNAATWILRADILADVVAALRTLLSRGPLELRIAAMWIGDREEVVEKVTMERLLDVVRANALGTKTAYIVRREV